MLQLSLG